VHGSEHSGHVVGTGERRIEPAQPGRRRNAIVVGVGDDRRSGRRRCRRADVAAAGEPDGVVTNAYEPSQPVEFGLGIARVDVSLIDDDYTRGGRTRRERRAIRIHHRRRPVAGADDDRDVRQKGGRRWSGIHGIRYTKANVLGRGRRLRNVLGSLVFEA
jgi:hypothetical protein